MPLRRYFFLILLCNFSIPGNHSNLVIMNPDIFCLRIKLSSICFLDNIVVKRFIKKFDL